MADYANALFGAEKDAPADDGVSKTDYSARLFQSAGDGNRQEAPMAPATGEGAGFTTIIKANIPEDQETKLRVLANSLFPNDPDARSKVAMHDGKMVFKNDQNQFEYASTGGSGLAAGIVSSLPEIAGGAIGSFAGNPYLGAILGGIAGKGLKQVASNILFDEPQTVGGNVKGMAAEGAIEAVGGAIGRTASSLYTRTAVRNAEKLSVPVADATKRRIAASTGIDLDYAQVGNIRQLRDLKKWASKFPSESAEIIEELDKKQLGQSMDAVQNKVLDVLSRETDPNMLASRGINAAQAAIDAAKVRRAELTRDLYKQASSETLGPTALGLFKTNPVITAAAKRAKADPAYRALMDDAGEKTVGYWHVVKQVMDDMADGAARDSAKTRASSISQAKSTLLNALDDASPAYREARIKFREASQQLVEPLENGVIGALAKIKGHRVAKAAAGVVDDVFANPTTTALVRAQIVNSSGEQAWKDILKLSMTKQFEKAAREAQSGEVVNFAGKFRQSVIGTPERKRAMQRALGTQGYAVFNDIMDAFGLIAKDLRGRSGSDTAFNQAITMHQAEAAKSLGQKGLQAVTKAANPFEWAKGVSEFGGKDALEKRSVAIAEALTDPGKLARLRELRRIPKGPQRAILTLSVLGIHAVDQQMPSSDDSDLQTFQ